LIPEFPVECDAVSRYIDHGHDHLPGLQPRRCWGKLCSLDVGSRRREAIFLPCARLSPLQSHCHLPGAALRNTAPTLENAPHSLYQTDGANAGLASCVVTGTADGAILVYDVRVGRGSSGLKPVTSLLRAHSQEVRLQFSIGNRTYRHRDDFCRFCHLAAATIALVAMVKTLSPSTGIVL
jgi:hypothetical protein